MFVEAQVSIRGTAAAVWAVVTDIAGAAAICRGIESVELLADLSFESGCPFATGGEGRMRAVL